MLKKTLLSISALAVVFTAFQTYAHYYGHHRHYRYDRHHHRHHHHTHRTVVVHRNANAADAVVAVGAGMVLGAAISGGCAPEVQESNVAAALKAMTELDATPEFSNATTYSASLDMIKEMPSVTQQGAALFALANVNPDNTDEVFHFIGARELNPEHVEAARSNLNLDETQAQMLLQGLQKSLKGNL